MNSESTEDPQRRLGADFYRREPHELARALIGQELVRVLDSGERLRGRIVELEVYGHIIDPASHGYSGVPTTRTAAMFGEPGSAYVYLIYGMYYCLNVVGPRAERPSALLVRALEPLHGLEQMAQNRGLRARYDQQMPAKIQQNLLSGPGKLCQAMQIDMALNEHPLDQPPLYIVRGASDEERAQLDIACGPRIGLNRKTVGDSHDWPWRYGLRGSSYLSRPMP